MAVKERRGRRRYVLFSADPPFRDRGEAIGHVNRHLRDRGLQPPHVIEAGDHLIVRCSPQERDAVVEALRSSRPGLVPLLTSGTLRKIRSRL